MDYTPSSRRLSEISHLFLSDVRQKQTGPEHRPARTPPGAFKGDVSIDLTPEEFAQVMSAKSAPAAAVDVVAVDEADATFKPLRAVVAHHLGESMTERVRDLAVSLSNGEPVGILYAGASGVRVCFVDPAALDCGADEPAPEPLNNQALREALIELDQDVCQWLLVLPEHRSPDSHTLLRNVRDWTLLTAADHDGIVAAYRALKGLHVDASPAVTLSVFGTADAAEIEKSVKKLAGVCEQFLKCTPGFGPAVLDASHNREVCLMEATADGSTESHWPVLGALVEGCAPAAAAPAPKAKLVVQTPSPVVAFQRPAAPAVPVMRITDSPVQTSSTAAATGSTVAATANTAMIQDHVPTVLELPSADATPAAMLQAVLGTGQWVESAVKAPMMPEAVVAVSQDRHLTLLAVARPGLGDLRQIAAAFRWMSENRQLIAMALPQFSLDLAAEPKLHVLIDSNDTDAANAHPLLATQTVTIAACRRVRFAGRMALLLDAA